MFLEFKEKSFVWFLSLPAPETMKTKKIGKRRDRRGQERAGGKSGQGICVA